MPRAPKKCARCTTLVVGVTFCPSCKPQWQGSNRPGSTRASRRMRDDVLARDPICTCTGCRRCTSDGCSRPSTEDDHIINTAAGGSDDMSNHRGLCHPCHHVKTQREARLGKG